MAVNVTIKPTKPINIDLDLDALSFGDALALMKLQENANANDENAILGMMDIISKLIGQDAKLLPLRHVQAIMEAVMEAIKAGSSNEKN